tara:strand:+ start:1143 stop:1400 length:258 start_codon:yes stop_codon:yes gene_type:complete
MILKYILLISVCTSLNGEVKCGQQLKFDILDGPECTKLANASGKAFKKKMKELGGSMTEYGVHCIAIDNEGYNVDGSFKISYNIL